MIVEEDFTGKIYRYHADVENPKFTATWGLTKSGKIVALHVTEFTMDFAREFHEWVKAQEKPLYACTVVHSIEAVLRRMNFKEYVLEE